jgi:hypothetical protein
MARLITILAQITTAAALTLLSAGLLSAVAAHSSPPMPSLPLVSDAPCNSQECGIGVYNPIGGIDCDDRTTPKCPDNHSCLGYLEWCDKVGYPILMCNCYT